MEDIYCYQALAICATVCNNSVAESSIQISHLNDAAFHK